MDEQTKLPFATTIISAAVIKRCIAIAEVPSNSTDSTKGNSAVRKVESPSLAARTKVNDDENGYDNTRVARHPLHNGPTLCMAHVGERVKGK